MEQERNRGSKEESGVPAHSLESKSEKTFPHPSETTIQTGGGAYVGESVTNLGGFNMFGGKIKEVHFHEPMPSLITRPTHPTSYLPFRRNPLSQPRPGEFEHLESLLLQFHEAGQLVSVGLVGVTGMGGIGKTQLAVEFAYRYEERFPGGIFWMPATGHTFFDWQRQFADLASKANYLPADDDMSNPENEARRARHFCRYLAGQTDVLLILDNVEDPNLVLSVLPSLAGKEPACAILYTSRSTLTSPGITLHSVKLLPEDAALRLVLETTRPELFAKVIANHQDEEADAARFICQKTGYLPLALVHLRGLLTRDQRITLVRLAEVLKQRGALDLAKTQQGDATPLFATFGLSWERIQQESAQRLFKLACYFPEATPIPLWLLGLAAGLGESGDFFEPLGEALLQLQELSLLEGLSGEEVNLHPLVREFGQRLVIEAGKKGKTLLEEATKWLVSACTNLNWLEQHARRDGYYECLKQVRAMHSYTRLLGAASQAEQIERVERWLDRESYLLADQHWWPTLLPGLFYQQIANRAVETGQQLPPSDTPACWLRQTRPVGVEDQTLLRIFTGHTDRVTSVAFSPDGSKVLTGSADETVRLWEVESGSELHRFAGHTAIYSAAFSPDGSRIVTGSIDGRVSLWEIESGSELCRLEGYRDLVDDVASLSFPEWIYSAAFSPDGSRVVIGSIDGRVSLWEAESGSELYWFKGHRGTVTSVAFSLDGSKIVTGSADETAGLWEAEDGSELHRLVGHTGWVDGVAFSSDGSKIVTNSLDGTIRVWEVESGSELHRFAGHVEFVRSVAFSPDGSLVVTGSDDKTARVWEVESGSELHRFAGHTEGVTSVAFSPDGSLVATGSDDKTARVWEVESGSELHQLTGDIGKVTSVVFSPDGSLVVTGSDYETMRLWEVESGSELYWFKGHPERVTSAVFSPDGSLVVATGSDDETARVWEVESGSELHQLTGHTGGVTSVVFSPDSSKVLTACADETARVWEVESGSELHQLTGHTGGVTHAVFSPDGSLVATGSADKMVRLWEVESGSELHQLTGHTGGMISVVFSPDGGKVVTHSLEDGTIRLWEVESGSELHRFAGHKDRFYRIEFTLDGNEIVTYSLDRTIRLWEVESGSELDQLEDHSDWVTTSQAISLDETIVVTCYDDGYVYFWQAYKPDIEVPLALYKAYYVVRAVYWQDATHVILADDGGSTGIPHFYHLALEGAW